MVPQDARSEFFAPVGDGRFKRPVCCRTTFLIVDERGKCVRCANGSRARRLWDASPSFDVLGSPVGRAAAETARRRMPTAGVTIPIESIGLFTDIVALGDHTGFEVTGPPPSTGDPIVEMLPEAKLSAFQRFTRGFKAFCVFDSIHD
jgi:hypothetical protein